MDTRHWSYALGALALVAPSVAAATQGTRQQETRQDERTGAQDAAIDGTSKAKPAFVPLGKINGATVRMRAEYDEEGDAKRPEGEIDDLIVRPSDGRIEWAVISFDETLGMGGKTVAMPMAELAWNEREECFDLTADKDRLEGLPAFDLDAAREEGLDQAVRVVEASWISVERPLDASGKHDKDMEDMSESRGTDGEGVTDDLSDQRIVHGEFVAVVAPVRFAVASELAELDVHARGEEFGDVSRCIVDCASGELAYVVVSRGGVAGIGDENWLLPFEALQLCHENGDADDLVLVVDKGVDELKRVKYEEPDKGVLDPQAARRADEILGR